LDPAGNTYWVQMLSSPASVSGSSVTINDLTPDTDPYNLSITEVLAAPSLTLPLGTSQISGAAMTTQRAVAKKTNADENSNGALILSDLAGRSVTDACSPGGIVTLNGAGFGLESPQTSTSFPLPLRLGGLQVDVNGNLAPLLFASALQVTFQCPLLPPGTPLDISLEAPNGLSRSPGLSVMREAAPELFTVGATNEGVVLLSATNEIAIPQDQSVPSRPAQPGEFITVYASGLGQFAGNVPAGTPAPSGPPIPLKNRIRVVVGGTGIDPAFAGYAPGTVGLAQVEVQLPQGVPVGPAVPLYIEIFLEDGTAIQSNEVTIAVR
jgi:uncharacterized protein (TIGR03437 family)